VAIQQVHSIMALDIGQQRTGVALATNVAGIASPLVTITDQSQLVDEVLQLMQTHNVSMIVIGLPRSLDGAETAQTKYVRQTAYILESHVNVPVHFIDEAVTSAKAEAELKTRKKPYSKEDIDMLAATYILEDFLREHPEVTNV
jgi:putative Holliday junction resolvase